MNHPLPPAPRSAPLPYERPAPPGAAFSAPPTPYWKYFDIARRHMIFIGLATALCTLAGILYAELATPVYQASMLVQVDNTPAPTDRLLGEPASDRDLYAATAPELEVLRSRLVVSGAVDSLRLFIAARPRYLPLVGKWLAARGDGLSDAGLPGIAGYAWGAERIAVSQFEVPASLAGRTFVLTAGPGGTYTLANDDAGLRLAGRVGAPLHWTTPRGAVALTVTELEARPGVQFLVQRFARLESIERLQSALGIEEQGKQSGVIRVALEGEDPERLALILNEIGRQYLRQNEERRSAGAARALAFLERQLPDLKREVESAESHYNQMRNKRGSIDLGEEAKGLLQQAAAAHAELLGLEQKRTELAERFGPDHPVMAAIEQQTEALQHDADALNERIKRLPKVEQDILRLSRDVKVSTEVYTAAMSRAQQLRLAAENRIGNARLLDRAEVPVVPVKPRRQMVTGAAALLGLLLATLAACVHSRGQWRVYDPLEVEQQLGLAVTAAIPFSAAQQSCRAKRAGAPPLPGSALLPLATSQDSAVEGLRRLCPQLQRALPGLDHRVIVIAGPGARIGRTFVAVNLAAVLAAAGRRVLLVDADLRAGRLHRALASEPAPGLAEFLAGGLDAEAVVRAQVLPRVDLIPAGARPTDPGALLAQERLPALLQALAPRYDYVVLDTSPLLAAADALAVAALGAATFCVVRSGITSAAEIDEATRELRQAGANLAGVIVNGCRQRRGRGGDRLSARPPAA